MWGSYHIRLGKYYMFQRKLSLFEMFIKSLEELQILS